MQIGLLVIGLLVLCLLTPVVYANDDSVVFFCKHKPTSVLCRNEDEQPAIRSSPVLKRSFADYEDTVSRQDKLPDRIVTAAPRRTTTTDGSNTENAAIQTQTDTTISSDEEAEYRLFKKYLKWRQRHHGGGTQLPEAGAASGTSRTVTYERLSYPNRNDEYYNYYYPQQRQQYYYRQPYYPANYYGYGGGSGSTGGGTPGGVGVASGNLFGISSGINAAGIGVSSGLGISLGKRRK